jgi:MFS family permease
MSTVDRSGVAVTAGFRDAVSMVTRFLINREYAKLWFAGAVSWIGNTVFDITVVLWVGAVLAAGRSWAPVAVSGVLAAVIIPTVLVGPFAGVLVDRWDDRRTMLAADLIRAVLIGALAVVAALPNGTLPTGVVLTAIYVAVFVSSVLSCFFNPARQAIVADIVPREQQARASGIGQAR